MLLGGARRNHPHTSVVCSAQSTHTSFAVRHFVTRMVQLNRWVPLPPKSRDFALTFCDGVIPQAAGTAGLCERPRRREQQWVVQLLGDLPSSGPHLLEDAQRACDSASTVVV